MTCGGRNTCWRRTLWRTPPAFFFGSWNGLTTESVSLSPFDYRENCLLYVPRFPPGQRDEAYYDKLADEIALLLDAARGHALVLFTSYAAMSAVKERLTAKDLLWPLFTLKVKDDDLLTEVERQIEAYTPPAPEIAPYEPSAGAVRLTNAINRGLEKPDQPEEIVKLILQGVSARYDCFQQERILFNLHGGKAVQYITIAADNAVTVTFKG